MGNPTYLDSLNTEQRNAVLATDGPVLILAGAGSGKTRVLTSRIAYLLQEKNAAPYSILAMTFTKKAANEMNERVGRLLNHPQPLWIGTFHSIFAKILRWEAPAYQYSQDFVIYDTDDQGQVIKSIMERMSLSPKTYSPKAIGSVISKAKNGLIAPVEFEKDVKGIFEEIVAKIYPEYQAQLRRNQAFDFDDLITVPIHIFNNHPAILEKYQERFRYLLVDEYQDTNRAQYQLIHALARKSKNLCVVGDDDQSIYGWRGADIRNILDFEKDFPETQIFRLEQNYRSTKNILKAAHSVVKNNKGRKDKELWSERETGESVEIFETEDERAESYKVVEKIREQIFQNKRSFSDFAILYRTNAQSRALEDGLRRSGISYVIVGGVRFYERKEIKDLLAYLKVIVNPNDSVSLKRIINFPARGIGDTSFARLQSWAVSNNDTVYSAIANIDSIDEIAPRIKQKIQSFYELMEKYRQLSDKISPNELVHTLVDEAGLINAYKETAGLDAAERIENIRELLGAINEYVDETEDPTLTGFLEEVALVADIDTWNDHSNAVTLMTLHSAKGLEFPVVFIAGLEDGLFPTSRSYDSPESLEEERRLFYVGITRAQEKVYLLSAVWRSLYGEGCATTPSRFLSELDESVITWESKKPIRQQQIRFEREKRFTSDQYTQTHPDYENISQEAPSSYHKGMYVKHETFGAGQITAVDGKGNKQKLTVRFSNGVTKKFVAQYAKFQIDV